MKRRTQHLITLALLQLVLAVLVWVDVEAWIPSCSLGGIDILSMLYQSVDEIKQFYPNFCWPIFLLGRFVRFGVPTIVLLTIIAHPAYRKRVLRFVAKIWGSDSDFTNLIVWPFGVTLGLSLAAYFWLRPISVDPFGFQRLLSKAFLWLNILNGAIAVFYSRSRLVSGGKRFLFEPQLPYALALTRILFASYSVLMYLLMYRFGSATDIGVLDKMGLPMIGWLIELIPVNESIYIFMCYLGGFVSFMIAIGYRTRLFLVLNMAIVFYVVATPNFFGKLAHQQLVIWIAWIMAFSPCADVLSVDARRNGNKVLVKSGKYGFHLKMIWLHFGLIYFFAGFFKLAICGFDWALTVSMINQVRIEWFESFDLLPVLRVDQFPTFLKISGLIVIVFELAYGFMLINRQYRWVSVVGGLIMHNLIAQIMYIGFVATLQMFYLVFIPWNFILTKLGRVDKKVPVEQVKVSMLSPIYLVPLVIFAANFLCGVCNINSYPFSVYPVYAEIVPDNVKYFEYRVLDKGKGQLDARAEGKTFHFMWERYSRAEYHMIRMQSYTGQLDTVGVRTMWKRWQLGVPSLVDIDSVDIYVVERPLDPDKATERLSEEYLMSIY